MMATTDVAQVMHLRRAHCNYWGWFHRAGLTIKPDENEVIFFQDSYAGYHWSSSSLPTRALEYPVEISNTVQYIDIFNFVPKLYDHIRIMTNRPLQCSPPRP
jgi:hypothetical protein